MVDTFGDKVEYVPGGATLNAIKVAQVCECEGVIFILWKQKMNCLTFKVKWFLKIGKI